MTITKEMLIAGHKAVMEFGEVILSANMLRRIYEAMSAVDLRHGEWMPIETAPKGRIVLVYYKNRLGNGRTMRARYYQPETLDSDTTDSGWADEGWYEESEAYEYLMPLDGEPTHWAPLPPAPEAARAHGIGGEA
jgi:hypothetical protein